LSNTSLHVDFDGLVSLVPPKSPAAAGPAQGWVAALPDLRSTLVPSGNLRGMIAPHVACILVPDKAVVGDASTEKESLVFYSKKAGEMQRLYELHEHGVRLEYEGKSAVRAGTAPTPNERPNMGEEHELFWVAQLSRVGLKDAGVFASDLIDKDGLPADITELKGGRPRGLTGVVQIDSGTLQVDDVVRDTGGDPVVFEFEPVQQGKEPHRQAQGAHIILDDTVTSEMVVLKFGHRSADGAVRWEKLVLRAEGRTLKIRVVNLELEGILGVGREFVPLGSPDPDFAVHYTLSAGWPFKQPLPLPRAMSKKLGGVRETCKGALFARRS
jgi:hypothetical protein